MLRAMKSASQAKPRLRETVLYPFLRRNHEKATGSRVIPISKPVSNFRGGSGSESVIISSPSI
jgi:hypothetical protein